MPEDQTMVLSMHYVHNPDVDGASDQTGFDFGVEDEVDKELYMLTIAVDDFEIPAETSGHTDKALFPAYYIGDFDIVSVLPHMHQLGVGYEMSIEHSDGSESCVVRGDYSFDNQLLYQFVEPLSVDSTDIVRWECTWDNPGAEAVYYGERTNEEMCIFFTIVSASSARDGGG